MSSFQALRAAREARHAPLRRGAGGVDAGGNGESESPIQENASSSLDKPGTASSDVSRAASDGSTPSPDAKLYPELGGTALEVRTSKATGRGLYATRAVAAGTTLLRLPPRTAVLSTPHITSHCSGCFQKKKVQRCAACKALHYCSAACQKADWASHKDECAALTRFRAMWAEVYPAKAKAGGDFSWVPNEAGRALGRMCWTRRAGRREKGGDPDWWKQLAAMATSDVHGEGMLAHQVRHLQHYLGAAVPVRPGESKDVVHPVDMEDYGFKSAREVLDMCSAFMTNSFTLTTPDLSPVGVATSAVCALFNHACVPNAVIVFPKEGTGMHVVAIGDIAPGEQVLTSYLDVSQPYAERRLELRERYGFACNCDLCAKEADPTWADPRWCVRHPGCAQDGIGRMPDLKTAQATVRCSCGEDFQVDPRALRTAIEEGKRLIAADDKGALGRGHDAEVTAAIATLSELIPDSAHPQLQLLHASALLLLPPRSDDDQARATALLMRCIAAGKSVYPAHHPAVALWMAERGRLMALQRDVSPDAFRAERGKRIAAQVAAAAALKEAADECDAAFGKGGSVAAGLREEGAAVEQFVYLASTRR